MKSVTKYIENVLRLKVNKDKSRIGRPTEIQYLGFAFYYQFQEKKYRMKVPKKSLDKVMKKVSFLQFLFRININTKVQFFRQTKMIKIS